MFATALLTSPYAMYVLKVVLDWVEPLNLFVHLCLFNLNYPANLHDFISQLFPIITLDMMPT
jgi:hypothetical protein